MFEGAQDHQTPTRPCCGSSRGVLRVENGCGGGHLEMTCGQNQCIGTLEECCDRFGNFTFPLILPWHLSESKRKNKIHNRKKKGREWVPFDFVTKPGVSQYPYGGPPEAHVAALLTHRRSPFLTLK